MSMPSTRRVSTGAVLELSGASPAFDPNGPLSQYHGTFKVNSLAFPDATASHALQAYREALTSWMVGKGIHIDTNSAFVHHCNVKIPHGNHAPNATIVRPDGDPDILICQSVMLPLATSNSKIIPSPDDWGTFNGQEITPRYEIVETKLNISEADREIILKDHQGWGLDREAHSVDRGHTFLDSEQEYRLYIGEQEATFKIQHWNALVSLGHNPTERSEMLMILRHPVFDPKDTGLQVTGALESFLRERVTWGPDSFAGKTPAIGANLAA